MAVTWTFDLKFTDDTMSGLRATGWRTDGEDVRRYTCTGAVDSEDLIGSKDKVLASMKAQHLAAVAVEAAAATILAGWATALENAMNSWEIE